MKKACVAILFTLVLAWAIQPTVQAQTSTAQQTLNQYLADLQKNPGDTALREKIIKHVQTMKPAPQIPEEARRNYVMGQTLFKDAQNIRDFNSSIEKFKAAALIAPWWGDAYRDLGMALKAAERYGEAINALKLFIVTGPNTDEARKAQDEIYNIAAMKEKADKKAKELNAPKELIRTLKAKYDGSLFNCQNCSHAPVRACSDEIGNWPCGCNEEEMKGGSNWYGTRNFYLRVSFPDDSTILFSSQEGNHPILRGSAKGPKIENIAWEMFTSSYGGRSTSGWKPLWVSVNNQLDPFMYSEPDIHLKKGTIKGRPINQSEYSPYERYNYTTCHP
jgi:tetratricopeptide (TPR) repeat protein